MAFFDAVQPSTAAHAVPDLQHTTIRPTWHRRRCQHALVAIVLACALPVSPPATAAETRLTLDEALRLAEAWSRQLPAQDAAVTAADEAAVSAGEQPDPVLKVGVDNLPVNGGDRFRIGADFMTMLRVGVAQEFISAEKRDLRRQKAQSEAARERVARQSLRANLQRDTALAWIERYFADRQRDVLVAQLDEARLAVEGAEISYRTGRGNTVDIAIARAALEGLHDRQLQLDRQRQIASLQLTRWIGEAAVRELADPPDWTFLAEVSYARGDFDHTLQRHPALTLLAAQERTAMLDSKIAAAGKRPDWTWELSFAQRGPGFANMISLGVSIPLPVAPSSRQDREIAAREALVEQLRAQRDDALRAHATELRVMGAEWNNFGARIRRVDEVLLPLARERTAAAQAAYRSGSGSLTAVVDARRNEVDVRAQRLELEREQARNWAQLKYLVPQNSHPMEDSP
mgnify:CR=1 FL=1